MKFGKLAILTALVVVSGCATQKVLQATGGSRSDGTIELSYEYGMFEKPEIDWQQGLQTARTRCAAWGYANAEAFGGQKRQCQATDSYGGCVRWFVTVTFQCTGK